MQIFLRSGNATSRDDESGYTWLYPTPVVFGEPGDRIEVCVSLLQWFPIRRNLEIEGERLVINARNFVDDWTTVYYWVEILIPSGNYSVDGIVKIINDEYERFTDINDRVEAVFDSTNLRFILKRASGATRVAPISIKGSDRIMAMLGFTGEPTYREPGIWGFDSAGNWVELPGPAIWTGTDILTSPSLVNFAGPTHAIIETSLQTTNVADETLSSSVLAKVPIVGSGFGELQTYQDTSTFSTLAEHEITSLTVRFRDSFGTPINFGELPWNLSLLFKVTPAGTYRALETEYSKAPQETPSDGNRNQLSDSGPQGS
jgi:hypothetical protein